MPGRLAMLALGLWPGLAQIWLGQEVLGIILALVFAISLDSVLAARFIWTESLSMTWVQLLSSIAVLNWLSSFAYTVWCVVLRHPERHRSEIDRWFREARDAYLEGRWADSRMGIERILIRDEGDADALYLLGRIHHRTRQANLARRAFQQCLETGRGEKWRWEIERALARESEWARSSQAA